jgi:hypothetical protein
MVVNLIVWPQGDNAFVGSSPVSIPTYFLGVSLIPIFFLNSCEQHLYSFTFPRFAH